jgi:hypothetical protein
MSVNRDILVQELRDLVSSYLGRKLSKDSDDKFLGREIGLQGGDSIQFIDEVEKLYSVPLASLLEQRLMRENQSFMGRLFGFSGHHHSDFTINELADHIIGLE